MKKNRLLKIENLHVTINENEILKGLDLEINEGEIHVLMGTNGTGKSTLVKTLSGHYDCVVNEGKITYKNKDLLEMDVSTRANEGIFMSFQSPVEVAGVNNSYFLKTAINAKRVHNGLEEIDAMEFLKLTKEETAKFNIDRKLLQRDLNDGFSGGEKKRLEIAQMMMLSPRLAVLDEIDSGLDVDALSLVAKSIAKMREQLQTAVVLITHHQRILRHFQPDAVHVMMNGRIVQSGNADLVNEIERDGYQRLSQE